MTRLIKRKLRHYFLLTAIAGISLLPFPAAFSEEGADKEMALKPEIDSRFSTSTDIFSERISLDLRDMDIAEALKFLASKVGINIVSTKAVSGRISLSVENSTIRDIFDIMLRANSLAYIKQGDIYNVMTETEYKALYGKNFSDMRQVKMVRLKYAAPEQAFGLLDALKSGIGSILVDADSGSVLMMDTTQNIERMQKALDEFDKENMVEVFTLKYAKAKEVEEILKSRLDDKKAGYITSDERNNQVIIQAFPQRMQEVERLIKELDKQTKEVLIDTKIVKVNLSDRIDEGVEWEGLFRLFANKGITYLGSYPFSMVSDGETWASRYETLQSLGDSVGSYPFSGTTTNYSASTAKVLGDAMHLGVINNKKDFDVVLEYLKTLGETRVISNPKIVAVNNQEAKVHIGERQAYVTTSTTAGTSTSTIAEEVSFVDVGVQLSVTPTINDDGYITMKIKPEISSVSRMLVTPTKNEIPIIDTSMVETTVMVKDGVSIIISGLRKDEIIKSHEQVPFLGKIPLLGYAFRSGYGSIARTELLIMLTPHIISGMQLTTGDERDFVQEGADYQDYKTLADDKKLVSKAGPSKTEPKSYREFKEEEISTDIKEPRYEP